MDSEPQLGVSAGRKGLHALGLGLQGLALVGILVSFLGFACAGQRSVDSFGENGDPFRWWFGFVACMVLMVVGGLLRSVGARGVAGSGLVLDPERAREDLEPWARTGGGLLRDALDETALGGGAGLGGTTVKVRCRACRTLNDEDARFCDHCGEAL